MVPRIEQSVDPFVPSSIPETNSGILTFPVYRNVDYDVYPFVRDGVPPLIVLMEGDQSKTRASDFFNPIIDSAKTDEQKLDMRQMQFIPYDEIDWSYPNIIIVIGQESRGISYAIAEKG